MIANKHMVEIVNKVGSFADCFSLVDCSRILAVPNPCLSNAHQFHPFAFSRHAYINCDDEWIFFQPCNANLYWNQEEKRCDRVLPALLKAPFLLIKFRTQPGVQLQSQILIYFGVYYPLFLFIQNKNKIYPRSYKISILHNGQVQVNQSQ